MGFRFQNLNPVYRICMTRLSSHTHKTSEIQFLNSRFVDPSLVHSQNPIYVIPRRWHLGHSHHDGHHSHHISGKEGENIFRLGLASDIALATGKALTGYLSGSTAIIADAAHSVSDVVCGTFCFKWFLVAHLVFVELPMLLFLLMGSQ